jgi:hypothetical protein
MLLAVVRAPAQTIVYLVTGNVRRVKHIYLPHILQIIPVSSSLFSPIPCLKGL